MSGHFRRTTRTVVALVALLVVVLPAQVAGSAGAPGAPVAPADAGLDWLAAELAGHDGAIPSPFGGDAKDWGLTIDAVLALAAGGRSGGAEASEATAAVSSGLGSYVTGGDFAPDDRYANALAKALLLERSVGTDLGGAFDVEGELRALEVGDGDEAGRFSDISSYGDFSNGIGHALAITALADTTSGVPADTVDFFLGQQCPAGGFRLYYAGYPLAYDPVTFEPTEVVEDVTCTSDDQIDLDATAFALQALLVAPPSTGTAAAAADAAAYLLDQQQADGSFIGTGAKNTNPTGLAGAALRAAGETAAADAAAAFVASLQHRATCADLGAIAYDAAAFSAGVAADRSQWLRATTQAVLGLGLPAYSGIGTVAPVTAGLTPIACPAVSAPDGGTTGTLTASASSLVAGGSVTVTGAGFHPGELVDATLFSTPIGLGTTTADASGRVSATFVIPADLEPGLHRIELVGRSSGVRASVSLEVTAPATAAATLPATGRHTQVEVSLAVALVAAGSALTGLARRRHLHGS